MAYRLEPAKHVEHQVQAVALERIDDALARLEQLDPSDPDGVENAIHEARKRCKELRGLARLVRPAIGKQYTRFNALVRDAADELSSLRDAHAVVATFDELRLASRLQEDPDLETVRQRQAVSAENASAALGPDDRHVRRAVSRLTDARGRIADWSIPDGFDLLGEGLGRTFERGRVGLKRARRRPTDERFHEWRKAVKYLWYQTRLLEAAAPSVLGPLTDRLDDLAESLGDDHDLTVLIARLEADRAGLRGERPVAVAVALAREQQRELRRRGLRLGATVYAEPTASFVARVDKYWDTTIRRGPELLTGGIADLAREQETDRRRSDGSGVERERKFLVGEVPELHENGVELRQGYLAVDGAVSVRVRAAAERGCTLTVKGGRGAVRAELEWPISQDEFEAAWTITDDRRVHKTRYELPTNGHVVELDVFEGELAGLVFAEVEFDSDQALQQFEPPDWFGREVTDDERYTNAMLATAGRPPEPTASEATASAPG
ncbi:MAG: CHAD domain-containing protein [Acidimicrobiia bacterium]|nr:CHAD domain-containing protein [Acidimicrobiia bacterium]